jgi:ADP-ribosylglycohydrolase
MKLDRRTFLQSASAAPAVAAVQGSASVPLRDKFFGCIAACHIGSSMAAPVEGWPYERIEEKHGTLDRLLSYEHYRNGWKREPGTTEDGVERQKLMIAAIVDKGDRVTAEDVRKAWVKYIKPESAGKVSEPFEATLLAMAKSGIPAVDIGKYCDYAGLVSMARSCHPIGLINAGDVQGAIQDVFEVGQLYQTANSRGLQWAAVTGMGIAAATKRSATVDSVLGTILETSAPGVKGEIERGLKLAQGAADFKDLRKRFDRMYSGSGVPYAHSYANEVVTKAVCVFSLVKGNPRDAIVAGVNFGRDTDCLTAVAAGLAGSLKGGSAIPKEWVDQVDRAAKMNPWTNTQNTLQEHADNLYAAFQRRLERMRLYAEEMRGA